MYLIFAENVPSGPVDCTKWWSQEVGPYGDPGGKAPIQIYLFKPFFEHFTKEIGWTVKVSCWMRRGTIFWTGPEVLNKILHQSEMGF